jgi:hypothetical protein
MVINLYNEAFSSEMKGLGSGMNCPSSVV